MEDQRLPADMTRTWHTVDHHHPARIMVVATVPRLPDNTLGTVVRHHRDTAVLPPLTQEVTMARRPRPHTLIKDMEVRHPITTRVEAIPGTASSSMAVVMAVRPILEVTPGKNDRGFNKVAFGVRVIGAKGLVIG